MEKPLVSHACAKAQSREIRGMIAEEIRKLECWSGLEDRDAKMCVAGYWS